MKTTLIRGGQHPIELGIGPAEVELKIRLQDAVDATIYLDWGEARELAETILNDYAQLVEERRV